MPRAVCAATDDPRCVPQGAQAASLVEYSGTVRLTYPASFWSSKATA